MKVGYCKCILSYNLCLTPHKASLQSQQSSSSNTQSQREKLDKLETDCLKLSRTQAMAEVIYNFPNDSSNH